MLSKDNSRGKEKHRRMTSPKPVIKVVSRRSWWSAVSSKSNSELCLCSWQLLHTEVVGGPSECSVRCMMGIKIQSDWGVNKRSVSRDYECRFFFHECSLWIYGNSGVHNLKRLQFQGGSWDSIVGSGSCKDERTAHGICQESLKRQLMLGHPRLLHAVSSHFLPSPFLTSRNWPH